MAHDTEVAVIPPPPEPMSPSSAAQRMRRFRKRRRLELRCVTVEVFEKEIESLIRRGLLAQDARNDPYAVRDALHTHLARTLGPIP
jgi:hypothetical protein